MLLYKNIVLCYGTDYIFMLQGTKLEELEQLVVAITVITKDIDSTSDSPKEIGVIIEGMEVIKGHGDIDRACCLLLGLTDALSRDYPKQLKYTFEVFQKTFLGTGCIKAVSKSLVPQAQASGLK